MRLEVGKGRARILPKSVLGDDPKARKSSNTSQDIQVANFGGHNPVKLSWEAKCLECI